MREDRRIGTEEAEVFCRLVWSGVCHPSRTILGDEWRRPLKMRVEGGQKIRGVLQLLHPEGFGTFGAHKSQARYQPGKGAHHG